MILHQFFEGKYVRNSNFVEVDFLSPLISPTSSIILDPTFVSSSIFTSAFLAFVIRFLDLHRLIVDPLSRITTSFLWDLQLNFLVFLFRHSLKWNWASLQAAPAALVLLITETSASLAANWLSLLFHSDWWCVNSRFVLLYHWLLEILFLCGQFVNTCSLLPQA